MGRFFSDEVELALRYIFYDMRSGKGAEGFELLESASAKGDGDASCLLARCLSGYQYVWEGHDFPEDDARADELIRLSVEQGSAIGVLVCMRTGEFTPEVEAGMPFASLQEAFDIVLQKAEGGEAFCQYVIGNTYFWWDFVRIQGKDGKHFSGQAEFKEYLRENISKCEDWFWKSLRNGIYFSANNLYRYYTKGDEDIILPQPEKAKDIWKIGAELGYPIHQYNYATELDEAGQKQEALKWFKLAAEGGEKSAWYSIGKAYEEGKIIPKDIAYAVKCYENGLNRRLGSNTKNACANALGALYYEGKEVHQDYNKAFELLKYAWDQGSTFGVCYLGKCYFRGWGTRQDYVKAREFLLKVDWVNQEAFYMLGVIHCQGLGVAEDIKKGVEYLQKAPNNEEAKAELAKYKKTLFGKWVRR